MIEIVLDENAGNTFLNDVRPIYVIKDNSEKTWEEYRKLAHEVITAYANVPIVIIQNHNPNFSNNWFAVALFIESCLTENQLECAVFKVESREKALKAYRPFIALTISFKYIIRLYQEELDNMYKEIAGLTYTGLDIKEDFIENKICIELPAAGEPYMLTARTKEEALTATSILKGIALTKKPIHIKAEIYKNEENTLLDINIAIQKAVACLRQWIN